MKLLGEVTSTRYGDFFMLMNETKNAVEYILLSKFTARDRDNQLLGEPAQDRILSRSDLTLNRSFTDYIIGGLKKARIAGFTGSYGNTVVLKEAIKHLGYIRTYGFTKLQIEHEEEGVQGFSFVREFRAFDGDNSIYLEYAMSDRMFTKLTASTLDFRIFLEENSNIKIPRLAYKEFNEEDSIKKELNKSTLYSKTFDELKHELDLSFYEDEFGNILKDYKVIQTKEEFIKHVIEPLDEEVEKCKACGEKLLLTFDSETTGLLIYNLSKSNISKDIMTAMSLSWKDDQAVGIFFRMEYFNNIDVRWALEMLRPYLETSEYPMYVPEVKHDYKELVESGFVEKAQTLCKIIPQGKDYRPADYIDRGAHNGPFDIKVFYDENVKITLDEDSLQMAFVLNPTVTKGAKKLKNLTRKLYGHETPELEDILGKGNEGMYHCIEDLEVAKIYICADTDYCRKLIKDLRKLMTDRMYKLYKSIDINILNIIPISEYFGYRMNMDLLTNNYTVAKENLEKIEDVIFSYVGQVVDALEQKKKLEMSNAFDNLSESEFKQRISNIQTNPNARYVFKISGDELNHVLYNILKYPVLKTTDTGKPSTDKYTVDKFLKQKLSEPITILPSDIKGSDGEVLVNATEFNKCKYPLALLLKTWAEIQKQFSSFLKPFVEDNLEGVAFKGISASSIDTTRISSPMQTLQKKLKKMAVPLGEKWWLCVFDFAQIEYRVMPALAKFQALIDKLNNPYADYHREVGSLIHSKPPYAITKDERDKLKGINFGIPYGLGEISLCINLFGKVTEDNLIATRLLLMQWEKNNKPIKEFLEKIRDDSLKPIELSEDYMRFLKPESIAWEDFKDVKFGKVSMATGRFKLFNLSDMDKKKEGRIRRQSGNYPIQGLAAEIFKKAIIRFYKRCLKEGLADKVIMNMYVHDEISISVHPSVHPYMIYKMIYEECMIQLEGHPRYYCGIAVAENWLEGKSDYYEAPVAFVQEKVKEWDAGKYTTVPDNPKEFVIQEKLEFLKVEYINYLQGIYPRTNERKLDFSYILPKFTDYYLKPNASMLFKPLRPVNKEVTDDEFMASMERLLLDYYGQDIAVKYPNGLMKRLTVNEFRKEDDDVFEIIEDEIVDEHSDRANIYWSFDGTFSFDFETVVELEEDDEDLQINHSLVGTGASLDEILGLKKKSYNKLQLFGTQVIAKCILPKNGQDKVIKFLQAHADKQGYSVRIKTLNGMSKPFIISKNTDLDELDLLLSGGK